MDIFKFFCKSFWSVSAYREAVFGWRWKMLAYFFLLSIFTGLVSVLIVREDVRDFYDSQLPKISETLSKVFVKNWRVSIPDGKPIEFNGGGKVYGVVTNGYVDAAKTRDLLFALENDRLTLYSGRSESYFFLKDLFPDTPDFNAVKFLPTYTQFVWIMLLPTIFFAAIFANFVYALILSAATYILSLTRLPQFGWVRCFKLSILALTPALCIDAFCMALFSYPVPAFGLALVSMFVIYHILPRLGEIPTVPPQD